MCSTSSTSNSQASDIVLSYQDYEVFLSFRGSDTRIGFTDHLYRRLIDANIKVYKDDEELRKGEEMELELLQAINKATIAIPIFSKRYAESKWCLNELVEINNRKRSREMKVMPIFYYITPTKVRKQTGNYRKAFALHEQKYDNTIISKWKEALSEIGTLSGWEIPSNNYSFEGKLVEDVTKEMSFALKKAYVKIPDCLVGLGSHVRRILEMLSLETPGGRIIGIHGMGGTGKTTLAKFVYNHLLPKFQGCSFLASTRSKDVEDLEKQMTSDILARQSSNYVDKGAMGKRFVDKKVLIVIDDVDEKTQIEYLIGKRGKQDWFALGSRIILTTRDEGFLRQVQVDGSYELSAMEHVHSLQLFCRHAFESDQPEVDYATLSEQIVKTTGGLPLALEVIGSSLCNKSKQEWKNRLQKLRDVPAKDVIQKLRISYDELDERQKHIFLDIACFFIGCDQRIVIHFWDAQKLYPEEAINVLQQKSLIKIHDNLLWMHDQLRDLGREIVRGGNIMKPERQTRLWNQEEATKIFMERKGLEKIKGICVEVNEKSYPYFREEVFAKLSEVTLFWVIGNHLNYLHQPSSAAPSNFLQRKSLIFSQLKWLSWYEFRHMHVETSNFSLLELAILDLSCSHFTIDWDGWKQIKMAKNLKVLNLTSCINLVKTPNFASHLVLERLILKGCFNLVEIDESIGMLKHLVHLNLEYCSSLRKLPTRLSCMESLTELLIDGSNIVEIPYWQSMAKLEVFSANKCYSLKNCISLNNLTSLKKLSLETPITSIPDSIKELVHLSELYLCKCKSLKKLPESIGGLLSLIKLDISKSEIEELPHSIGCLKNLKLLRMCNTPVRELPYTIGMLGKLEEIDASGCKLLHGCLPMLPQSLINLIIPFNTVDVLPDLSNLINLKQLRVDIYRSDIMWPVVEWEVKQSGEWVLRELAARAAAPIKIPSPWWIGRLSKVERLDLAFPLITTLHPDLGALSLLTELSLLNCVQLQSIPELPSNLRNLVAINCRSLVMLPDLLHLESLQVLTLDGCMFSEINGMSENLRCLRIQECPNLERLPEMSKCKNLKELNVKDCPKLVEIHGRLESIQSLVITNCESLVKIPDILDVKTLDILSINSCPKLSHKEIYRKRRILTYES